MSNDESKIKKSKRLHQEEIAIKHQLEIVKLQRALTPADVSQSHRYAKHHAMDCGNSECYLCGNPRKTHKDKLTVQEKRFLQDIGDETVVDDGTDE